MTYKEYKGLIINIIARQPNIPIPVVVAEKNLNPGRKLGADVKVKARQAKFVEK